MASDVTTELDRLAERAGIEPFYHDYFGRSVTVSASTKEAFLHAMRFERGDAESERGLEPAYVVREDRAISIATRFRDDPHSVEWSLTLEDGSARRGRSALEAGVLSLPGGLPLGYHALSVRNETAPLIVVPQRAWLPPVLAAGNGTWGLAVQLYALRTSTDWGIGDFSALAQLTRSMRGLGAQAVGLNPLHAPNVADPRACSPYDPTSRLSVNPLYIDVESVPEYAACERAQRAANLLRPPRDGTLVDYEAVTTAKLGVLELCYDWFVGRHRDDARRRAFAAFVDEGGVALRDFAIFSALAEHVRATTGIVGGWSAWPQAYRDRGTADVRAFETEYKTRIGFHLYLQWIADEQLAAVARAYPGTAVGLYRDLAVGTCADGADSWSSREAFVPGISIGAPPDAVNTAGQNWGLTPFHPARLREAAYAPFVALLRANMRHAGALRIDHVMAMQRLFWIPQGRPSNEGAYVRYPFEDLIGIIALESVRARCAVVGEDLGTVPEGFRERLGERGIFGCRLMLFEREADGRFRAPEAYPSAALVSTGTHDLPSLPAWWVEADLDERERLHLYADEVLAGARNDRDEARRRLLEALRTWGDLHGDEDDLPALVESAYRMLAKTPSRFLIVQLEDVLLQLEAVNIPGTHDEHPNWRRRVWASATEIAALPLVERVAAALRAARPAVSE